MDEVDNNSKGITRQGIDSELATLIKDVYAPHDKILDLLLEKVEEIDFHELAGVSPGEEVPIWKLIVIAVDEILRLAKFYHWGICKNRDFIYLFNGAYWFHLDCDRFMSFLGEVSHKLGVSELRSRHYEFRKKLLSQFQAVANMPPPRNLSGNSLINLTNGTLEIGQQGTNLRAFDRNDFLTYQLPFSYNPEARAPVFKNYLETVLSYRELRDILAEYIGYVFIPNQKLKLEKTILLYGTGANGKSVFFDVINALLGRENVSTYSLQNLTDKPGYYRAMVGNKLVNYASEINRKLDPTLFKQLVSGEPVEARLPYGQPFILENYAKLMFNTNELPKDVEHTNAYFRRFLIIPFEVVIPEQHQDKNLANKIIASELPGVLNWVLEGMTRLLRNKNFTHSDIVSNQVKTYKNESDTAWLFIEEMGYAPDTENYKSLRELYSQYKTFCSENNYRAYSNRSFVKQLRSYQFETRRITAGNIVFCKIDPTKYI